MEESYKDFKEHVYSNFKTYTTEYFNIIETFVPKRKTPILQIIDKQGCAMGEIKWFGAWRKFCFFPIQTDNYYTVWDTKCLSTLIEFINDYSKKWKENKKIVKTV